MSFSVKHRRGGQPSITTPTPPPWDSPQVVMRKSCPNEFPMRGSLRLERSGLKIKVDTAKPGCRPPTKSVWKLLAQMESPVHFDFMLDQAISDSDELHAPAEALRRARRALTEHAGCFWMRQPSAPLQDRADVKLIVRRLRE